MPKNHLRQIGVTTVARTPVLGSMVMSVVMVENNSFWRRFASLPIRNSANLTREQRDTIVTRTEKHCYWRIHFIKPNEIPNNATLDDYNALIDLETKGVVTLLNQIPSFWESSKIFINYLEDKQHFLFKFRRNLTKNLALIEPKFAYRNWYIQPNCDEKICSLASIYAQHAVDLELDEIQSVWGKTGTGEVYDEATVKFVKKNTDCPHIRVSRKYQTYNLVETLKEYLEK